MCAVHYALFSQLISTQTAHYGEEPLQQMLRKRLFKKINKRINVEVKDEYIK